MRLPAVHCAVSLCIVVCCVVVVLSSRLSVVAQDEIPEFYAEPVFILPTATPAHRYIARQWGTVQPGLEYGMYYPPHSDGAQLMVVRIDPVNFVLRVHYRPGAPLLRDEWAAQLPCASVFVNAHFFDRAHEAIGLVAADGVLHGRSLNRRGGMLFVDQQRTVGMTWLVSQPYRDEPILQAVQGYPMLIRNGVPVFEDRPDSVVTRRTAVGMDKQGRVLVVSTPGLGVRLSTLADYLTRTDLDVEALVNLDGGSSSLLHLDAGRDNSVTIDSLYPVPSVLAVYASSDMGCSRIERDAAGHPAF